LDQNALETSLKKMAPTRMLDQHGNVSYGLGGNHPLRIEELISILYGQYQAC